MLKLNLGCGTDIKKDGYLNVDYRSLNEMFGSDVKLPDNVFLKTDLSYFPWRWEDNSVDEILMLDFLEHHSYRLTNDILCEAYRILKPDGFLDVQVPDFEHCARAAIWASPFYCNKCPYLFDGSTQEHNCPKCNSTKEEIMTAAIHRLYGGQDYPGNWHHTAFTGDLLYIALEDVGFVYIEELETMHQRYNWNKKFRAYKRE